MTTSSTRPLLRLFPVLLCNLIAFGVAIPILPALVKAAGGGGMGVGLVFGAQALGQLLTAPWWGKRSDMTGRRSVIMATIACALVLDLVTAWAGSFELLLAVRFVYGLCAGTVATATALVADATEEHERSKGMAIIGIGFGLGFTIGPAVGALASIIGRRLGGEVLGPLAMGFPFIVSAGINALALLVASRLLVEASSGEAERRSNRMSRRAERVGELLQIPALRQMAGLFLAYSISVTILETTFFLYMKDRYGFDERQVGLCFAGMGLLAALVQGGVGQISARIGDRRMTIIGGVLLAVGLIVATAWEVLGFLLSVLAVASVGRALLQPGGLALGSSISDDRAQTGKIMGVLQSAQSMGRVLGPLLGGALFDLLSPRAPFVGAGIILALAVVWWASVFREPSAPLPA